MAMNNAVALLLLLLCPVASGATYHGIVMYSWTGPTWGWALCSSSSCVVDDTPGPCYPMQPTIVRDGASCLPLANAVSTSLYKLTVTAEGQVQRETTNGCTTTATATDLFDTETCYLESPNAFSFVVVNDMLSDLPTNGYVNRAPYWRRRDATTSCDNAIAAETHVSVGLYNECFLFSGRSGAYAYGKHTCSSSTTGTFELFDNSACTGTATASFDLPDNDQCVDVFGDTSYWFHPSCSTGYYLKPMDEYLIDWTTFSEVVPPHENEVASASAVALPGALDTTPALASSSGFTFIAVLKQTPTNTGYLLANSVSDSGDQRCFQVMAIEGNKVGIFWGEDTGARQSTYRTLTTPLDDGNYHALAIVVQSDKLTVYVDGTMQGSSRSLNGVTINTCPSASTLLGVRPPSNTFPFAGELYSVKLYDTALSAHDMVAESALPGSTPFEPGTQSARQTLGTSVSAPTSVDPIPIVNSGEGFSMIATDVVLNPGARGYLFANSVGDNEGRCFHWFIDSSTDKVAFFWGEHEGGARQAKYLATGIDVDDGAPHTYSFSISTANELKLFVDFVQVGSAITLPTPVQTCPGGTAFAGGRPPSTSSSFDLDGTIGSLAHFNAELTNLDEDQGVVFDGNIEIYSGDEAELSDYAGVNVVTGFVRITGTSLTNVDALSSLHTVWGYFQITSNSAMTNASGLASLTTVVGNMFLSGNPVSDYGSLSMLTTVGGTLSISSHSALANLSLPSLTTVNVLSISLNDALTDITGMSSLTAVPSSVLVQNNPALVDLDCLSSVASIGGSLTIRSNAALASVGLSSLASVELFAVIEINAALTNLNGLSSLTSIGDYLHIANNAALTNLDGLSSLTSVGNYLNINNNAALTNLNGLSSLTSIGEFLTIYNNAALANLDGLSSLTSVGDYLHISSNAALTNLNGLSSLTSISENLSINNNAALTNLDGLSSLTSVDGDVSINVNNALPNLDGLSSLTSIGGGLAISNALLNNLDGLSSLTSIGDFLKIQGNSLTNVDGLSSLTSIGDYLEVRNNPALTSVAGFSALTTLTGYLRVRENSNLVDIGPLAAFLSARGCSPYAGADADTGQCNPV